MTIEDPGLLQFAQNLAQEIIGEASLEEAESFRAESFTSYILEMLEEEGETEDWSIGYLRKRGIEVAAFGFPEGEQRVDLFGTIYSGSPAPATVTRDRVSTAFDRLLGFYRRSVDGLYAEIEESSSVFDAAQHIHQNMKDIRKLRLFLLTDGLTTLDHIDDQKIDGVEITRQVWDIRRIYHQHSSGAALTPVVFDAEEAGYSPIPCLPPTNGVSGEYSAYMATIPGEILASLYDTYGPRLLERNVRTYLMARGKVNRGILSTIKDEPELFLAYNNGITITAESIDFREDQDSLSITKLTNLQIVNGGQTTASIHRAKFNERANISSVSVAAKIIQVEPVILDDLVPRITRFANSQNRVSEADLSANDPFNVAIEEFSRNIWAPAVGGSQQQTRWFFERARGQYQELKNRAGTPARQRDFARRHPPRQKFTKTDLAKYVNTWDQLPHEVSKGAAKSFGVFMGNLADRGGLKPDELYFKRLIAKAILFKSAEKIVRGQKIPGPYANVVTYTLAYISNKTSQRVDLDRIWEDQAISQSLTDLIDTTSMQVRDVIDSSESHYNGLAINWVKLERCWGKMQELLDTNPLSELEDELIQFGHKATENVPDPVDDDNLLKVKEWTQEDWFSVSSWAKETENLQSWQRSISFNIGRFLASGRDPSRKMAKRGVEIQVECLRLGYAPASKQ